MPPEYDSDIAHYRQERIAFIQKKLKEKLPENQKKNYSKALELYQKEILPGPKGKYHITYIQDGELCDINHIRPGPYLVEVSMIELVLLSLFC